eukprot:7385733-Prymnesium_polylepis.1
MMRKISITGFVLIISEEYEHLRVLLALVVSITSLALHLALKPFVSAADNAIAASMQLCLVILYLSVLLIKFCDLGEESCAVFGLGSTECESRLPIDVRKRTTHTHGATVSALVSALCQHCVSTVSALCQHCVSTVSALVLSVVMTGAQDSSGRKGTFHLAIGDFTACIPSKISVAEATLSAPPRSRPAGKLA